MNNILTVNQVKITTPILTILTDIKLILTNGKLKVVEDKGAYIRVTCPFHKDGLENKPSCSVFINHDTFEYGSFNCFTCGNHGSFDKFVAACFGTSISSAQNWLINKYGEGKFEPYMNLEKIILPNLKSISNKEFDLSLFEDYHPYMTKRHISDNIIKLFDLKYDPEYKAIVFPIKDRSGKIRFLTRRTTEGKKFYIDHNADTSVLYGIDKIDYTKPVYIVESLFNCLSLWSWGKQALCTFGSGVTKNLLNVLNNLPVRKYILAFDNDTAGKHGTDILVNNLNYSKFIDIVLFTDSRDINDLTKEEFEQLKIIDRAEYKFTNTK